MLAQLTCTAALEFNLGIRRSADLAIDPMKKKTPTLGKHRGFFEDLFGNIGTVGVPGAGAPGGDGQ